MSHLVIVQNLKLLVHCLMMKVLFMAFSTIVSDFSRIMLTKYDGECDDSDSDMVLVDTNRKLSIHEAYNDWCEEVVKLYKLIK